MPMYSLRVWNNAGLSQESMLGFYHDEGAVAYASRMAGGTKIEIWRDQEQVAVVDRRPVAAPIPVMIPR